MKNNDEFVISDIKIWFSISLVMSTLLAPPSVLANEQMEKCYGIVKAGMNDCGTTPHQACAGSATKDNQTDAYILMPHGLCKKIVGGSLKPKAEK